MVLLWILLLLCTQGRKQALGRWYPVVQSAWMVRRESVHVLVTVGVTLGTTANKLPQSSSGMMFSASGLSIFGWPLKGSAGVRDLPFPLDPCPLTL